MINRLIHWALSHRLSVLIATGILILWGVFAIRHTPVDAIPDLSDVQVIIKATYPGQSPQIIEDQITYPLTTTLMSVPNAKTVRGYSFFGDAYVYVLFDDKTDLYWARSRVLEYLNQAISKLPANVKLELGPDATGVGWIFEYALVDRTGQHDIAQLRSLQDWFLKYELRGIPNIAEVATLGGMVKQYQITLDPNQLRALNLSLSRVIDAVKNANQETGGSVIELGEADYMVRTNGYLKSITAIENIPLGLNPNGTPILLKDVARVQLGPEIRRGIAELNGQGEVVGGIIVMRSGKNALTTIDLVKQKLQHLKKGLPSGVELITTYDRSQLIQRAIHTLKEKVFEEMLVVTLVSVLFLLHLPSAFVAVVTLPMGILIAFIVMYYQGINANIMSLGGIAIAIGAMVDAAVVMVENAHKHCERWRLQHPKREPTSTEHLQLIRQAATEVGPALFFSLLIITLSFLPIFTLEAQEGKLFAPLAFTKTYAMAAAAGLSVTLVPTLMYFFVRGPMASEHENPINRFLVHYYKKSLLYVLEKPKLLLIGALCSLLLTLFPLFLLGSEFMPPLNEGDLLFMPTTLPGLSIGKASQLLQQTDKLIAAIPEVNTVFGKMGRAETATDPAPLEMMETTIQLKPKDQWRAGMTEEKLIAELDRIVKMPGIANVWVQPIRNRIDMLSTGIKSPVGIKVAGPDLKTLEKIGVSIETLLKTIPGTSSAFSERATGGRYITIDIDRLKAARYGLNIRDIQAFVSYAIGGENISETIEGLERYPINLRFDRNWRDSLQKLRDLPIITTNGEIVPLGSVAVVTIQDGPPMIKSENARPSNWIYVDIQNRDLGSYVREAQQKVREKISLPPGYSISWSGQYEYLARATERLWLVVPITLGIIFLLLYVVFQSLLDVGIILLGLPFALIGGFWFVYLLGYHLSVAVSVGFIALAGIAAEFGVVMLIYLHHAIQRHENDHALKTTEDIKAAIIEGAVMRLRPKSMTVFVIMAGLLPILLGHGTGAEVMRRIAAPMMGGMITAPLLSLFVIPVIYLLLVVRQRKT